MHHIPADNYYCLFLKFLKPISDQKSSVNILFNQVKLFTEIKQCTMNDILPSKTFLHSTRHLLENRVFHILTNSRLFLDKYNIVRNWYCSFCILIIQNLIENTNYNKAKYAKKTVFYSYLQQYKMWALRTAVPICRCLCMVLNKQLRITVGFLFLLQSFIRVNLSSIFQH